MLKKKNKSKGKGPTGKKLKELAFTEPQEKDPGFPNKHSVYFKNLMAERRIARYLAVAEEVQGILKISIEDICNCIGLWKGDMGGHFARLMKDSGEDLMTDFGLKIFRIGEILGAIQSNDPITFWTSGEKEQILSIIIPMAKDAVKLRRKLTRISDGMIWDLKKLRRLVDIYGFGTSNDSQSGNVDLDESAEDSDSELGLVSGKQSKNPMGSMFHFLRSAFKSKPKKTSQPKNKSGKKDSERNYSQASMKTMTSMKTHVSAKSMDLKTPSEQPSEKLLQKIASCLATPKNLLSIDYILDPQDARIKGAQKFLEVEKWKMMSESNGASVPEISLKDVPSPIITTELSKDELEDILVDNAKNYFPMITASSDIVHDDSKAPLPTITLPDQDRPKAALKDDVAYDRAKYIKKIESGNQNEGYSDGEDATKKELENSLNEFEQQLDSIGIPITKAKDELTLPIIEEQEQEQADSPAVMSENPVSPFRREEQMVEYKALVNGMHESVLNIIEQIRSVERTWMTTGLRPGMAGLPKIGDILAFIRKTVEVIDQSEVGEDVYPEIKKTVIQAIDPVYREAHACFIALGELTQVVSTDVSYLKELLVNFPKGDLIVHEYSSDASLGSLDQIEAPLNHPTEYIVNLDAIFG